MTNQGKDPKCRFWCWAIAALLGAFIFIMLMSVAAKSFGASLFLGLVGFVLLGLLFNWLFCAPVPTIDQNRRSSAAGTAAAVGAGAVAAGAASAAASGSTASSDASAKSDTAATSAASEATSAAEASGASASVSAAPAADVKPSAPLAGEAELAERKGEYKYEAPASDDADGSDADAAAQAKADKQAATERKAKRIAKRKAAEEAAAAEEEAAAKLKAERQAKRKAAKAAKEAAAAAEEEAAAKLKAERQAKRKAAKAAKEAAAAEEAATPDYDGDGVFEGKDEGSKPELLTAARAGGADDLKRIKGIGPKLEGVCNDMGVYHFDQIAAWTDQEMAWVNANLQGFKGRATRDKWVEQAKLLAAGEETEFSKRVDKGSVY